MCERCRAVEGIIQTNFYSAVNLKEIFLSRLPGSVFYTMLVTSTSGQQERVYMTSMSRMKTTSPISTKRTRTLKHCRK